MTTTSRDLPPLRRAPAANGTSVELGGFTITDPFMGDFHHRGIGEEFDSIGSFQRPLTWTAGTAIPKGQLHVPGGRA